MITEELSSYLIIHPSNGPAPMSDQDRMSEQTDGWKEVFPVERDSNWKWKDSRNSYLPQHYCDHFSALSLRKQGW
jgi:hypothetical protein